MPAQSNEVAPGPGAAGAPGAGTGLKLKLVWLTVFRTVATSLLFGALAVRTLSQSKELTPQDSASFFLIGAVFLLTLVYGLYLRRGRIHTAHAYGQVFGDVVIATALVYLTGGADSPFGFTYLIAILAASILDFQRGAFAAAVASFVSYTALCLAIAWGRVRGPDVQAVTGGRLAFLIVSNGLAQFLIAALASYLARLLTATRGQLSAREADLREMAGLQRQILASMPSGLVTCGPSGDVIFLNRAAAGILGIAETFHGAGESILPGIGAVPADGTRQEISIQTREGSKTLGLSVTRLAEPQPVRLILFQDLTGLRRAEMELRRADQLAALGRMAAQLAHELKNPLASMRGSAQMIARDLSEGPSARLAQILIRESDRLAALVDGVLRYARPPAPALRECAMDALVADIVEMMRTDPMSKGIQLETELEPVRARVDPDQMRQVVLNLLRNALAAVEDVRSAGRPPVVRVSVHQQAGLPALKVWDSAGSIAEANLERIFEPFFTTREKGTGLGLATSHALVRANGGAIHVASSPSDGTEFVVTLPAVTEVGA